MEEELRDGRPLWLCLSHLFAVILSIHVVILCIL